MIWIAYGVELEPQRPDPFGSTAGTGDSKWGTWEATGQYEVSVYQFDDVHLSRSRKPWRRQFGQACIYLTRLQFAGSYTE